ncbi:MAG: 50S ribosomal protein L3 [Deltaproteobacteria bacterium]|nr:MAG: 50S ribosomal protein L3 [Deltaproteobacteria bacterium]
MLKGIIGRKVGMTQIFSEEGERIGVTVVEAGPCKVTQKKTEEKDGYSALQLGFREKKKQRVNKALQEHFQKSGGTVYYHLQEFRVREIDQYEVGQDISVGIFKVGELVNVSGKSKGKGFAGMIKRHHARGGAASHGSMFHRAPGSIGASSFPSRVFKGKKLPGHMGNRRVTLRNLQIVGIDEAKNILVLKGAIPGANNGILTINGDSRQSDGAVA